MSTKTFTERCHIAQQFLPDAQYKAMLTALHADMLAKLAEQLAPVQSLRDTLERPAYTHALALKNLRDALELVLRWVDDWCETGPETGFDLIEEKANAALADQPAQQEPERLLQEIARLHDRIKDLESDVEFLSQPAPVVPVQQEPFGYFKAEPFGWTDCAETDDGAIALYTTPQAQPAPEIAIADAYRAGVDSGIAAEREACARVCDDWAKTSYLSEAKSCAKIIRARGNT